MSQGRKLRDWIKNQGMNQAAFAACMKAKDPECRASQPEVSRWVTDKAQPSERQRYVIQAITGIPAIDWLPEDVRQLVVAAPAPGEEEECDDE